MRLPYRLLGPPQYDTVEKNISARLLNGLLITGWITSIVMFVAFIFFPTNRAYNLSLISLVGGVTFSQWILLRQGFLRIAGWAYILMLWAVTTGSALRFGGLHSTYPSMFLVVLVLTSILFGPRPTLLLLIVNILTISAFWAFGPTYDEAYLMKNPENMSVVRYTVYTMTYILVTVVIFYTERTITTTLSTLREQNAALESQIAERERVQTQLSQSEARFRSMFDNAPLAIMMMEMDRSLRAANPRASQMFDITPQGSPLTFRSHRLHPEDDTKHGQLFQALAEGEVTTVQTESRLYQPDIDDIIWVRVTFSRVEESQDEAPYVLTIIEDISEARLATQQRLDLQLERERLAFLQDFVGKMTHDLKTPLSIIKTSTYLLRRKFTDAVVHTFSDRIDQQVVQQMEMIENILTVAQLDHLPELNRQPIDLNILLRNVVETQRPEIIRQNHTLKLDLDPGLPACLLDEDQLSRALTNLVNNAVKYTAANGAVTVRSQQIDNAHLQIIVADTGIGIPPEALPQIFERFYRAEATRQSHHGTGLGLAIVKEIVERHGGTIEVESKPGSGTTFTVVLPTNATLVPTV